MQIAERAEEHEMMPRKQRINDQGIASPSELGQLVVNLPRMESGLRVQV